MHDIGLTLEPVRVDGRPLRLVGRARIYVCGVTPYDVTHLGHAATFVWVDALVRVLRHHGVETELCRNTTDVDEQLLEVAASKGERYDRFAAVQQFWFEHDMTALQVQRPTHEPRAHNFVREVVALAAALVDADRAYIRDGNVYFRGAEVPAAAGLHADQARRLLNEFHDDPDDPRKESPYDVVVWRAAADGEPAWPSPWSPGRPGWHAECSAMALTTYGPSLDIHAGGAELAFPHHAYEAAQAEAVSGVRPFARAWVRVGTVRLDGGKMAKSTGNLVLVGDLLKEHTPAAVRLLVLSRRWWEPWDYRREDLAAAEESLAGLYAAASHASGVGPAEEAVLAALRDDLDVPTALAIAQEEGGQAARTLLQVLALR